jgi:hypothetical protein
VKAPKLQTADVVNSRLLGAAAEHFVMCELLRRNYIAALAPAGVPDADIIVSDRLGEALRAIQVKARRAIGSDGGWHMNAKHESMVRQLLFYCFVDFGMSNDPARCWIIPSAIVADTIKRSHFDWLATPGRGGKAHNDTDMRRLLPDYRQQGLPDRGAGWMDQYRDAWRLIGQPSPN